MNAPNAEPDDRWKQATADSVVLAKAEVDAGAEEAVPLCLRCFAPLEGAPTTCPNCGAGASRSAMLGPSVAGGVDVGAGAPRLWLRTPRRTLTVWTYLIVWVMGLLFIPPMTNFGGSRAAGFWGAYRFRSPIQLPIVLAWSAVFWWLVLREARKPASAGRPANDAPPAP